MFFLVHFCTKILKKIKKILIIIQRSNGDVFLSANLIMALYKHFDSPKIDLLVNDDTFAIANMLPNISFIHQFSYQKKNDNKWRQEKTLIQAIYKKYDLSINLTASDRSVIYSWLSGKRSISAIEKIHTKSWWKKLFLSQYYYFDSSKHILVNNSEPLKCLGISFKKTQDSLLIEDDVLLTISKRLEKLNINKFIIFHPSAQYWYKIYSKRLRSKLLIELSKLGIPVIVTGSNNRIDLKIKSEIPKEVNIFNFIGETSLEEYFALSYLSLAYIGMDTLNMHIAASQNKRIFAIFGPTKLKMWAPWSNEVEYSASKDMPIQTYGNVTIFQADMPCVACGNGGCDNKGMSECLDNISPAIILKEVERWTKEFIKF